MSIRRRNILILLTLALLTCGWQLFSGASRADTGAEEVIPAPPDKPTSTVFPFTVGVLLSPASQKSDMGNSVLQGAMLATKEIQRDALKENVRAWFKLETIEIAGETEPETLAARVEELGVNALLCGLEHVNGQCFFNVCGELNMPLMTFDCIDPLASANDWVFSMGLTPEAEGRAMAVFVFEDLGISQAGIYNEFDHMGYMIADRNFGFPQMAESFERTFTELGGKVGRGITAQPAKFVNGKIDLSGNGDRFSLRSVYPPPVNSPGIYGEDSDGNRYITSGFNPESQVARVKGFNKRYEKLYKGVYDDPESMPPPTRFAALSYDAVWLLADAHRRSHSTLGEELRDALAATRDFPGVTGALSFDEQHRALRDVTILKLTSAGPVFVATIPRD